jgi:hypothetical protein
MDEKNEGSDTPESDKAWERYIQTGNEEELLLQARHLERDRNSLASKFTRLDKPKYSGDPMLDAVLVTDDWEFREWVARLPATYWARYDLSAARIGWAAAKERFKSP